MSGVAEVSSKYLEDAASNAIPVGYKQTDVGVIPDHWGVSRLRDLLKEPPKYGINAPAVPLEGTLPVYIRITDISEDGYFKPSEKVGVRSPFSGLYQLSDGDVVLARTGASVGKSYLYKEDDGALVYAGFLIKVSPDKKKLEPRFLSQYLKTQRYWSWVTVNSMRSGQPGINGNEYGDLLIPLPKIQEQTAIANALSDVDALISELEKLIAKKQAIKTATMQQLLTGRTRLPQFALREDGTPKGTKPSELGEIPEDWEVVELGSVIEKFIGGGTPSRSNGEYWGNQIPWVTVKDFSTFNPYSAQESITKKGLVSSASNLIPKGTLITSTRMALGKAVIYQVDVAINQDMKALVCGQKLSTEFLYFWFEANKNKIDELGSGSTVKGLSLPDLRKVSFLLPPKDEQTAIATILSDMDAELQALEQRLGKTRQIKQGMMQELLTGKTRLIKPSKEVIHE
ncbi:restriction endonuclease subunit S [Salmonella enterica subsp. enterica serovar Agona]|uniref:restriction endonuclease subunit S n=1 Tax=Shewanella indica TaxID=768528 RepID=UPI001D63538D|nr:restriction endonuclease subunit S [Shewanella indica]EHH1203121.1 restriction endonuclease subunit S [Salmonella enterica subsp. enterica serovar Agona]EHH1881386.1 restriction endonuclease subunit S [Salmonella enterica subsp. enterica serovar Agona]EHH1884677.1 restriction endonuclease subunit S [Salmonella enterica subsp. enterica serovar Agona]EHM9566608.1 restriction endonuclease subunit S [Salmonella enterica subsp. enterica serovar Agona]EHM9569323.1 restriction endonuclease subunit